MPKTDHTIIFLGTAPFAIPFLQALLENTLTPVLVVTQPDRPVGRNQSLQMPPVKLAAKLAGIPVAQPETKSQLRRIIKEHRPDVCVLVAYGMLIDKETLGVPQFGFVNVHPSLLPKYRGSSPVQTAILNGDELTGVSIMLLDEKMDHGPILAQASLPILATDTNETLHDRLAIFGAELLVETLGNHLSGKQTPWVQDEDKATYTRIIQRQDGLVDWQKSAVQIERQNRAFYPWPGIYTRWGNKRLKIVNLSVLEGNYRGPGEPGTVFLTTSGQLAVQCGTGAISINRMQLEGKKDMAGTDAVRGYPGIIGTRFV